MLELNIEHDLDAEFYEDTWEIYSFCRNHTNYKHPEDFGIIASRNNYLVKNIGLRSKLKHHTAFILSYYQHSGSCWFLCGKQPVGTEFQWDGVKVAGIMLLKNSLPKNQRKENAEKILELYNQYINGQVYGYTLYDGEEELDSCWGFYDYETIIEYANIEGKEFKVTGEAFYIKKNV